ncbi:hypothetical protein ACWD26_19045 [Streptomyces sp. NPDC002787]
MADVYELQLALGLPESLPPADFALLRWHLGQVKGEEPGQGEYPLMAERGPAWRIGGVLVGELDRDERGWALTVRQEVHPDDFSALRWLVRWLGERTSTVGVIGYLRFYEALVPDVLVARDATVRRVTPCAERELPEDEVIPQPWGE